MPGCQRRHGRLGGAGRAAAWRLAVALVAAAGLLVTVALARAQTAAQGGPSAVSEEERQTRLMELYDRMVQFNLNSPHARPASEIDAEMARLAALPVGERIADWAEWFYLLGDTTYVYGRDPQGYVTQGRLVDDCHTDCVLFFYRTTELGRSSSALEAVQFAFGTRFYGASLEEVVRPDGRVDYDTPVHLEYAMDILRSGYWGADVTAAIGPAVTDEVGTSRYPAGTIQYVPKEKLALEKLQSGDIVFFITDERTPRGQSVRQGGDLIGHLGIVKVENGTPFLIHAASKGIAGLYPGARVEKIELAVYLKRVETFKGVMATRIENF
jgi:hypothetical protein